MAGLCLLCLSACDPGAGSTALKLDTKECSIAYANSSGFVSDTYKIKFNSGSAWTAEVSSTYIQIDKAQGNGGNNEITVSLKSAFVNVSAHSAYISNAIGTISLKDNNGNEETFTVWYYGLGTNSNPYKIFNAAQLRGISDNMTASYKLMADISVDDWASIFVHGKPFQGRLFGNGKTVRINSIAAGESNVGLIRAAYGCYVEKLKVVIGSSARPLTISNPSFVGGIFAFGDMPTGQNTEIRYCTTEMYISINQTSPNDFHVGGIIGFMAGGNGSITNNSIIMECYSYGSVRITGNSSGQANVGGIVGAMAGKNNEGSEVDVWVYGCYSDLVIENQSTTITSNLGGIAGYVINGRNGTRVRYCYALGNISSVGTKGSVGGIVGRMESAYSSTNKIALHNCVALNGSIQGGGDVHRIVGSVNANVTMYSNYARSNMTVRKGNSSASLTKDADKIDGADISQSNWTSSSWWTAVNNGPGFLTSGTVNDALWNLSNLGAALYPKLKNNPF
jgi:hypothetical protein